MPQDDLVAGIDSSTQSVKVLLVRASDGTVVDQSSAPHPGGTEVYPDAWWEALQSAGDGLLERAAAVGVGGQQHGMVCLDDKVRSSAQHCCGTTCGPRPKLKTSSNTSAAPSRART